MIRFSEYLNEVSTTKRQGIQHLSDMDPVVFVNWLRSVKDQAFGFLKNIKAVSKLDGLGARFGKDKDGNVFFEGSRTGPVFDVGAFSAYARNRSGDVEIITRATHYDDILSIFKKASFMSIVPTNVKIVCEIFYNPMAQYTKDGIIFVTIEYDKNRLGKLMTICPYSVLDATTGQIHPDSKAILSNLYRMSSSEIRILNPDLKFGQIEISGFIDKLSTISDKTLEIIKSRNAADREQKQSLLNLIQKVKDDLSDYILQHPGIEGKFMLGDNIEGIVLHLPDKEGGISPYKIITKEFTDKHKKEK